MTGIDRLIYNELTARRAVKLPEVGTLFTERTVDEVFGTVLAPARTRIVFTKGEVADAESVVTLIEALGVEPAAAAESYRNWLQRARVGEEVRISGVGVIENGSFTPLKSILGIVNPEPVNFASDKPRCKPVTWTAAVLIPLGLVVAGLLLYHCMVSDWSCSRSDSRFATDQTGENIVSGQYYDEPVAVEEAVETEPEQEAQEMIAGNGKAFYVVAGSFEVESNADKYIRDYNYAYPGLNIEKVVDHKGRYLVTLFGSDNRSEAERMAARYQNAHYNYDIWVYAAH